MSFFFFFSSRRRHTRFDCDWSSDVCSSDLTAAEAQTKGSSAEEHPSVIAASAKVREAYLALQRTRLVSPVEGYVAKRGVQLGQRVASGAPLMTVVGLHNLWVDADRKSTRLNSSHSQISYAVFCLKK